MICDKCSYKILCPSQFVGDKLEDCQNYQCFVGEELEWYEEEMQFQKNMEQLYTYDEDGFCDGFPT